MVLNQELERLGDRLVAAETAMKNAKSIWAKKHWANVYASMKRRWQMLLDDEKKICQPYKISTDWCERYYSPGPLFWFERALTRTFDRNSYAVDLRTLRIQQEALREFCK